MKRFANDLVEGGAGTDVVRIAVQVARSVLGVAVDAGALKANPATALKLARPRKAEQLFLGPEQVEALALAIAEPYDTLVRFAAYTGLRAGEICALRVKRIDFLRGRVEVAESVSDVAGRLIVGPTKTYANRHVPLPAPLRDELAACLAKRGNQREGLVFTGPQGGPLRHGNFYRAKFKPAVLAAGLPESLRFHDLRHTYAAFCIASTADPYAVMRRMGHSSITVTYDTYGHMFPERDAEITDRLEDLFRRGVDCSWTESSTRAAPDGQN
jgi:integrase